MRALPGHTHRFRDMGDGLACLDTFDDQSTGERREPSVTVRHEDLLVSGDGNPHITRRSSSRQAVTNLLAEYN